MSILDYPQEACKICAQNVWWYSIIEPKYHGPVEWVCGTCHPPATPEGVLKMRIIRGTYMLNRMRHELSIEDFEEAVGLIKTLWEQLAVTTKDCLYIENKKKLKKCVPEVHHEQGLECFYCSNDYWWTNELWDSLDREKQLPAKTTKVKLPVETQAVINELWR